MFDILPILMLAAVCVFLTLRLHYQHKVLAQLAESHNTNTIAIAKLMYGLEALTEALDEHTD